MIRLGVLFAIGLIVNLGVASSVLAIGIDPRGFFQFQGGVYRIELHGGIKPHSNSTVKVSVEADSALVEAPFCIDGQSCDVGYQDFPFASTQVDQSDLGPNHVLYKIRTVVDDRTLEYEWENQGLTAIFRHYRYPFPSGEVGTLEHVLSKLLNPDEIKPSIAVEPLQFFKSRVGKFKIELTAGIAPHANSIGTVEDLSDENEALITLGYCDDKLGFCDIGYRDCPYNSTAITDTEISSTRHLFKLTVTAGDGGPRIYEWEEDGNQVWFRSLNYPLPDGSVMPVLEHVLTRIGE